MRQALDLRLEGLPYVEIADAMGVSIPTAFRNADVAR
jgi:hypothetical protein